MERTRTITIDAPTDVEAAILRKAERAGLSVSEFTLRALLEAGSDPVEKSAPTKRAKGAVVREQAKQEARARLDARRASGAYVGLSVDGFLAERADDLRLDNEQEGLPFVTSDRGDMERVAARGTVAIEFIR